MRSVNRRTAALMVAVMWATACSTSTSRPDGDGVAVNDAPGATASPEVAASSPEPTASASDEADTDASEPGPATSDSTGSGTTGSSTTGSSTTGSSSGTTTSDGDDPEPPPTTDPGPSGPVAPEVVRFGVIAPGGDRGANVGMSVESEEPEPIVEALVDYLNETGGIAGRPVEAIVRRLDQTDQSGENQRRLNEEICTYFTEDVEVLLVVAIEPGADKGRACYADRGMPFLEVAAAPDEPQYRELSPWLLPGLFPHKTRSVALLARALDEFGFLNDKIGVVARSDPSFVRSSDLLIEELERRGGTVIERADVPGGVDNSSSQMASVVLRFKNAGVNRVVIWHHGGAAWTFFANNAEAQQYRPWYGISSFDAPHEIYSNGLITQQQVRNSMGFGFYPSYDTAQENYPITPSEQRCFDIVNERIGTDYNQRALSASNGWVSLQACELMFQTREALDPLDGQSFERADLQSNFRRIADDFEPVQWPRARFRPDKVDGNVVYRRLAYHEECDCFDYSSPWLNGLD